MKARLRYFLNALADAFWLVPAAMVAGASVLAVLLVQLDRGGQLPHWLTASDWFYNGGGTGARTLLGAIASSAIGVAGTVFSITIAALSLAAGQMGPRLLRNFTRDRGVQCTLGAFLGTFSYALMVLRTVRTQDEGVFTPHLALTFGIVLAFGCIGTLVYFVAHMASRINVGTVVNLVSEDMRAAVLALVRDEPHPEPPAEAFWAHAAPVCDARRGYLQQLDADALADWAAQHGTALRLLVRQGDYVFPGAPIALLARDVPGAAEAIRGATALEDVRGSAGDAGHAVRQLVEVAVRALSPGVNDPHTALGVLDQLGAALCDLAGRSLPTGVWQREGRVALVVPVLRYASLVDAMFHMVRQNASTSPAVLLRLLQVLTAVLHCESDAARRAALARHAALVWADAQRSVPNPSDVQDIGRRYQALQRALAQPPGVRPAAARSTAGQEPDR